MYVCMWNMYSCIHLLLQANWLYFIFSQLGKRTFIDRGGGGGEGSSPPPLWDILLNILQIDFIFINIIINGKIDTKKDKYHIGRMEKAIRRGRFAAKDCSFILGWRTEDN